MVAAAWLYPYKHNYMINTNKQHDVHVKKWSRTSKLIYILCNVNQQNAHFLN
jgi:hypothetical protein